VALVEKLTALVENPDLRQKMGDAGKTRARTQFDWRVVYPQYQTLYGELQTLRHAAQNDETWQTKLSAAPRIAANRLDPFYSFGHYPTTLIQPQTHVILQANNAVENYAALIKNPLFNYATQVLPNISVVEKIVTALSVQKLTINALSQQTGIELGETVLAVAVLAKMDLVRLA
jgi:starch synthase